jgi:hypothetical protein
MERPRCGDERYVPARPCHFDRARARFRGHVHRRGPSASTRNPDHELPLDVFRVHFRTELPPPPARTPRKTQAAPPGSSTYIGKRCWPQWKGAARECTHLGSAAAPAIRRAPDEHDYVTLPINLFSSLRTFDEPATAAASSGGHSDDRIGALHDLQVDSRRPVSLLAEDFESLGGMVDRRYRAMDRYTRAESARGTSIEAAKS